MKIYCKDCLHEMAYILTERTRHWCEAKKRWIPQRHYDEGRKKCGKFTPIKKMEVSDGKVIAVSI